MKPILGTIALTIIITIIIYLIVVGTIGIAFNEYIGYPFVIGGLVLAYITVTPLIKL